jgi:hypothetical protein
MLLFVIRFRYHCLNCPPVHTGTTHTAPRDERPGWRTPTGGFVACMITKCSCSTCIPTASVMFAISAVTVTKLCPVTACGQPSANCITTNARIAVLIQYKVLAYRYIIYIDYEAFLLWATNTYIITNNVNNLLWKFERNFSWFDLKYPELHNMIYEDIIVLSFF